MPVRIAINGFGRIGRQIARIMLGSSSGLLELTAVNTLESDEVCAHLLQRDTLYGGLPAPIEKQAGALLIGGKRLDLLHFENPEDIPWRERKIDLVIDSSGALSGRLQAHLRQGASKVIAAGSVREADAILCMGVNHTEYDPEVHHVVCAGSCTTNCIAPAASLIHEHFGIDLLTATIVHSYTTGQNLLDGGHADLRRARSAAANIIPTTTSATEQLGQVLPELAGRVAGVAMRVPTPVVHAADLVVKVRKPGSREDLLAAFEEAAASRLKGILAVSHAPLVSSDLKGASHSCVVDADFTGFHDDLIKTVLWHDNEHGYSSRVVDLVQMIAESLQ